MGPFVDSLDPQQRAYLHDLLIRSLVSGRQGIHTPLSELDLRPLRELLAHLRNLSVNDEGSDIRPFFIRVFGPGVALARVSPRILNWRGIFETQAHIWVAELGIKQLTVELSRLKDVNTTLISWLTTLAQHLPTKQVTLRGAPKTIHAAIKAQDLGQILLLEGETAPAAPVPPVEGQGTQAI